jgi:hypothetical protein
MKFDFKKFEDELCDQFADNLDRRKISDLLDLHEQYNLDTPLSTGKRLIVTYVAFNGVKQTSEISDYSGNPIQYSRSIGTGVNIWVADNLKGKSSIFKIIKYALTGNNSLKANIKAWLKEIVVHFRIGEKPYTVYMNTEKRLKAYLVNGALTNADEVHSAEGEYLIEAKSESDYSDAIQDFFFKQFSYYSLKWTQKIASKDKNELLEVGASWSTYFTSILLESKDSQVMYGAQGKKIFEMLLGLELTYPINQLKVKADLLRNEMAKEKAFRERQVLDSSGQAESLQQRLNEIDQELAAIEAESNKEGNIASLIEQYNDVIKKIKEANDGVIAADAQLQRSLAAREEVRSRHQVVSDERRRMQSEIQKITRSINDLKEYLEIGIFFSNLEIKQCPSCNHDIPEQRRKEVTTTHKCYVCSDDIKEEDFSDDSASFEERIANLESLVSNYQQEEQRLLGEYEQLVGDLRTKNAEISAMQQARQNYKRPESLNGELTFIESQINNARISQGKDETRTKLIADRAIIDYQIKQLDRSDQLIGTEEEMAAKIELLDTAVNKLTTQRYSIGQKVMERLCTLMLSELKELGLTSFSAIQVTEKFDILYQQDGEMINFTQIAEGEQLRAKIAFYLSLIQLDIEFNFGRHTRLLIIDSPAKEEADENYLQGFSAILTGIQQRFGDKLQILIGTAQRELVGVVEQEYVTPPKTYVF